MSDQRDEYADIFPEEIAEGIEALDNRNKRAVFALLYDNPGLSYTEIQEELGGEDEIGSQTLSNTLEELKKGGLIDRQIRGEHDTSRFNTAYSISNFGELFLRSLLTSLGSRDGSFNNTDIRSVGNPAEDIRDKIVLEDV